jgi:uncharacterized membrane protein
MASVDIGGALTKGISTFKANPVFHILSFVIVVVVSGAAFGLLTGPMLVGYFKTFAKEDSGAKPEIGDLFKGFDEFVPALLAAILGGILINIGFILCIIPGLLIAAILPLSLLLIARGEQDGIQALQKGWALLKPNLLMAAIAMIIIQIIGALGVIACGIGLLITGPIAAIATWQLCQQLAGNSTHAEPVQSV